MTVRPRTTFARELPGLALAALVLAGCTSSSGRKGEPPSLSEVEESADTVSERDDKLKKAVSFIQGQEIARGLELLYELEKSFPTDQQIIYLLARTLQDEGSIRPAKQRLIRLLEINPDQALALQRLAEIHERLGEHPEAILAYQKLAGLVPKSADAMRRIAANYLIRGEPRKALPALEAARERNKESKREDPIVEYLTAKVYEELGEEKKAAKAIRAFLKLSEDKPEFARERAKYEAWLRRRAPELSRKDRQTLLRYARSTLSGVLIGDNAPEALAKTAGERLFSFDDSPVFVALVPPRGLGPRLVGRARDKSLIRGVSRALNQVLNMPFYNKDLARRAAIVISIQTGGMEPIEVKLRPQEEEGWKRLETRPEVIPGVHGLAVDSGRDQPFVLPWEAAAEGLGSAFAMLEFACQRDRLERGAWTRRPVYRFLTTAFAEIKPGAPVIDLRYGEPMPFPSPSADTLWESVLTAGDWAERSQQSSGAFGAEFDPQLGRFLTPAADLFEFIEFEQTITIAVRARSDQADALASEQSGAGRRRLVVALDAVSGQALKARLDQLLGVESAASVLGEGDPAAGVSYQVSGRSSEAIKITLEAEIGDYDLAQHFSTAWALARLARRSGREAYMVAARKAADWGRRWLKAADQGAVYVWRDGRGRASDQALALLAYSAIDRDAKQKNRPLTYRREREALARGLAALIAPDGSMSSSAPGSAPGDAPTAAPGLAIRALLAHASLTGAIEFQRIATRLADNRIAAGREAQKRKQKPFDAELAAGLAELYAATRKPRHRRFARSIADAYLSRLRDPGTSRATAGGVDEWGRLPRGSATAEANLAFTAMLSIVEKLPEVERRADWVSDFRLAAIAAAGYQLRHQIRREHVFYFPNIGRALGAYRTAFTDSRSSIADLRLHIDSLLDVMRTVRDSGRGG